MSEPIQAPPPETVIHRFERRAVAAGSWSIHHTTLLLVVLAICAGIYFGHKIYADFEISSLRNKLEKAQAPVTLTQVPPIHDVQVRTVQVPVYIQVPTTPKAAGEVQTRTGVDTTKQNIVAEATIPPTRTGGEVTTSIPIGGGQAVETFKPDERKLMSFKDGYFEIGGGYYREILYGVPGAIAGSGPMAHAALDFLRINDYHLKLQIEADRHQTRYALLAFKCVGPGCS
jgi:hypothetical protein